MRWASDSSFPYRAVLGNRVDTGWYPMAACLRAKKWSQMRKRACAYTIIICIFNVTSAFHPVIIILWFQKGLIVDFHPHGGLLRAHGGRLLHGRRHLCFMQSTSEFWTQYFIDCHWICATSELFILYTYESVIFKIPWTQWMEIFLFKMFRI